MPSVRRRWQPKAFEDGLGSQYSWVVVSPAEDRAAVDVPSAVDSGKDLRPEKIRGAERLVDSRNGGQFNYWVPQQRVAK